MSEQAKNRVDAYLRANPGTSKSKAFKVLGINSGSYYATAGTTAKKATAKTAIKFSNADSGVWAVRTKVGTLPTATASTLPYPFSSVAKIAEGFRELGITL